jgi:hypothetical protein
MKIRQLPAGQWLSVHATHAEKPGIFDTLLNSPDFFEDNERSTLYTLCPAEKKLAT